MLLQTSCREETGIIKKQESCAVHVETYQKPYIELMIALPKEHNSRAVLRYEDRLEDCALEEPACVQLLRVVKRWMSSVSFISSVRD